MMVRDSRDDWEAAGSLNMYELSVAKAKAILNEAPKEIIPAGVQERVNALIAQCEKEWK